VLPCNNYYVHMSVAIHEEFICMLNVGDNSTGYVNLEVDIRIPYNVDVQYFICEH
jgi:hypothetical protein